MAAHIFGRHRPSQTSGFALQVDQSAELRDTYFHELPAATGKPPYHLALRQILPTDHLQAITEAKKLVFHLNGTWAESRRVCRKPWLPKAWKLISTSARKPPTIPHFSTSWATASISTAK